MNTFFKLGSLIQRTASQISPLSFPKSRFFSDGESAVYHHARLFKKPLSTKLNFNLFNSVSLMGFVDRPIRVIDTGPDRFGVFTTLRLKHPLYRNRSFRIYLSMWDAMARMCIAHLKPNDHILVSGRLASYSKSSSDESCGLDFGYQVNLTEVNYAAVPPSHVLDSQISEKPISAAEDGIEESKNDEIYLWQVFFSNPYEWWDNRRSKKNPRQPDFKHKDTGEALWLGSDLPDWVIRRLELLDQRKCFDNEEKTRRGSLSEWL
ncbi:PREDICTED: protein OSB1, mitochondrial-like isoform X1 [Camelina sativa]|uniref:Protein OSB1, mitochondrial-like isoform X1 n=1 Tax=Camelina sativa TaxID=90675 RepID=A0ABM0YFV8_CAMSA|nr:PREDICTED: protein OSB1, mitochondrial-like isoform X1 [Camelina sativa]